MLFKFSSLHFRLKFLISCLFAGLLVCIFSQTTEVIRIVKLNSAMNSSIASCKLLPPWEILEKGAEPVKVAVLCEENDLMTATLPSLDFKAINGAPIGETYKKEIILQHKIVAFAYEKNSAENHLIGFIISCLSIFLFIGLLPYIWAFFLKRLSEVASAIRGGKN